MRPAPLSVATLLALMAAAAATAACGGKTDILDRGTTVEQDAQPEVDSGVVTVQDSSLPDVFVGIDATPTPDVVEIVDATSGPDSGIVVAEAGTVLTPTNGMIFIEQGFQGSTQSSVFATFYGGTPVAGGEGCMIQQSAAGCAVFSCPGGAVPSDGAGTLTLAGGALSTPVNIPGGNTGYNWMQTSPVFAGGASLSVTASGGVVPAFGPIPIAPPPPITLVTPAPGTATISTQQDLTVSWTGGVPGAQVVVEGAGNSSGSYFLCSWDATLGKVVVPQSIVATNTTPMGFFAYGQTNSVFFMAGSYLIGEFALPYGTMNVAFQ